MTPAELLVFLRGHRLAVQSSVTESGDPQAVVVGFAVSDRFEVVFDTVDSTRKVANLRHDPRIALVIAWDDEQTVRSQQWPGITYFRVRRRWIRYSDYRGTPRILKWSSGELLDR